MPKKNKKEQSQDKDTTSSVSELQELEARIEKMLDPRLPDEPKKEEVKPEQVVEDKEPKTVPSAPEVPGFPVPEKPLEIKVLREEPDIEAESETENKDDSVELDVEKPDAEPVVPPEDPGKSDVASEVDSSDVAVPEIKEDPETAKAVADIIAKESDDLLAAEDEKIAAAFKPAEQKSGRGLRARLRQFWQNKRARNTAFALLAFVIITTALVPNTRYFMLNLAGVRVSSSVRILDESTFLPLKNVEVSIAGVSAKTDSEGVAKLERLKLGSTELRIYKRAFAEELRRTTLGWGSNQLGDYNLQPTGTQYAFELRDFLSDKPITEAEAVSGDASAFADKDGKILLTMDEPDDEFEVTIASADRRSEKILVNADSTESTEVAMVPARPHVFISKRSGTYDVYRVDADGKNEELLLEGTGSERQDMTLVLQPSGDKVALVSTREGVRNEAGYLLNTLTLVDLSGEGIRNIDQSERIQLVDWSGSSLVYVKIASGASASDPKRHRLMSYDAKSNHSTEIASSNYFNDVLMVHDKVYYAPSQLHQKGVNVSMFMVEPDGSNQTVVISKETWNIFRSSYNKLSISLPGEWHEYDTNSNDLKQLDGEPANLRNRVYVDSPDSSNSAWVDIRDGKGVLIAYDVESEDESVLQTRSGLSAPVVWLSDDTLVFRVKTNHEAADYAISLAGGEPKKIRDVTNTSGIDTWYYY